MACLDAVRSREERLGITYDCEPRRALLESVKHCAPVSLLSGLLAGSDLPRPAAPSSQGSPRSAPTIALASTQSMCAWYRLFCAPRAPTWCICTHGSERSATGSQIGCMWCLARKQHTSSVSQQQTAPGYSASDTATSATMGLCSTTIRARTALLTNEYRQSGRYMYMHMYMHMYSEQRCARWKQLLTREQE